jgi:hypothetical protein
MLAPSHEPLEPSMLAGGLSHLIKEAERTILEAVEAL